MESKNEQMVQTLVAAVLSNVDRDTLLDEIRKRGLVLVGPSVLGIDVLDHVDDATLIAEAAARNLKVGGEVSLDAIKQWIDCAGGKDKREIADNLPARTLADSLVAEGHIDLVLQEIDADDLWYAIDDKDHIVQSNIDDLDQESLLDAIDDSVKEDMCNRWWQDNKREMLAECDDAELWESIGIKEQFQGDASVEAVERVLTDCDTDGLIAALGVIAKRLRGW